MYRIVITKEEEQEVKAQEWHQLYDSTDDAIAHDKQSMYGYVTKTETAIKQTQMLDQRVEDLDMKAVIKAVNRMGEKPNDSTKA